MAEEREAIDRFGLEGHLLDGRIEVRELVAEGGFGLVYRGFHREQRTEVALKVLLPPPDMAPAQLDEFVINFAMEARTLERLRHPNIVRVIDAGEAVMPSGHHTGYIALEWIDGVVMEDDLEARRGQGGRSPREVFALMRGVLDALAMVHQQGVAHRDIKPGNLMVLQTPSGPLVRLLDFGIAKAMRSDERAGSGKTRTFSNLQAYSPQYAAPEQLTGARTGPWTDVHAMALILSELLTDEPPLEGNSFPQLLASAMNPRRPTPARRNLNVGAWEPVLRKALSLRPDDRFHNAGEFLAALESTLPQAFKRPMSMPDPDDPALAQTLTGSHPPGPMPSQPPRSNPAPAKPSGAPAWLHAPKRPELGDPPGTRPAASQPPRAEEPPVVLTASLRPGEMPRPSTPLAGVSMPSAPAPPRAPPNASTLPPPRRAELTAPYQALPAEVKQPAPPPAPPSALRGALVLLGGVVVGVAAALGIAFALGVFDRPPAPRAPSARPMIRRAIPVADAAMAARDASLDAPAAPASHADAGVDAVGDAGEDAARPGDDAPATRHHRRHRRHRRHSSEAD